MEWLQEYLYLFIALLIGMIVGTEREYKSKSAGLRTMIMVCLSSCLFTILSLKIGVANPDRLAANILTGLGFLGAGVIFKDDNKVTGITTATTIWMVAALGMAVGAGYLKIAVLATVVVMFVLVVLVKFQGQIEKINQIRNYRIVTDFQNVTLEKYEVLFAQYHLKSIRGAQHKNETTIIGNWILQGTKKNHESLILCLLNDPEIKEFTF